MLHELLFALQGFPGSIFIETDDSFTVTKGLPFVHPSEAVVLDKLCSLGYYVKYLKRFVSAHRNFNPTGALNQEKTLKPGFYLYSVCSGIKEILRQYSTEILSLEQEVLKSMQVPLMTFQERLDKYHLLFPALKQLVWDIESRKVHGCGILEVVHKYSITGLPFNKECFNLILKECHGVLCRQVCSWMLHGTLHDPHREFFIRRTAASALDRTTPDRTSPDPEIPLESMEDFALEPQFLPEYLSASLAKKVLFAGSAVCIFGKSLDPCCSMYGKDKDVEFQERSRRLQECPELDLLQLEAFVEDIRSAAAAHLWHLFVEEGCLPAELRLFREMFLIGRGELFLHFSQAAEPLLCSPRSSCTEQDVNDVFQQSCNLLQLEDENIAEQFQITVGPPLSHDQSPTAPPLTGWETIGMSCKVKWPLHVFFKPSSLSKYSRLFRLLIGVQRAQASLQSCWLLQSKLAKGALGSCPLMRQLMHLRSHMAHLLDTLQYYLQVDVMESHLCRLLKKVAHTRDFEAIQHAHHSFLTSLLTDSMLSLKPVRDCLREILGLCQSLCDIFPASNCNLTQREFSQFECIAKKFESQKSLLTRILESLSTKLAESCPLQLLSRLDHRRACSGCTTFTAPAFNT